MHPHAGKPARAQDLTAIPSLVADYYTQKPDPAVPSQRVSFGTSGHRGSAHNSSFNEAHILAISQALCEYRAAHKLDGPLFLGIDTHALSEPAFRTALEVFAAHGVEVRYQEGRGYTPTPVVSHAVLTWNRHRTTGLADGVVLTPSHNPPSDGGFKYNPTHGGPAGSAITSVIQARANVILEENLASVMRVPFARAMRTDCVRAHDFISPYVEDLGSILDMDAIAGAGLTIGVDPLGGAGIGYWGPIAERFGLSLEVVNPRVDPTFSFMTLDHDGKIRMDCSSPFAMAGLIALRDRFDIAFGNDPDYDRHGIVTRQAGLLNPNHYLAAAVDYLFQHRKNWPHHLAVGKTLVTSSMLDRVADSLGRKLYEVPVGFKWFVDGLIQGALGFGGEESAGATFVRRDGSVWSTDKDGMILALLAAEMLAVTGEDPGQRYRGLTERFGHPLYRRVEAPASLAQKAALKKLSPSHVLARQLAGDPIVSTLTKAPGNQASLGGLKVMTEHGWFAARPSGTEAIYKIYAESFRDETHLHRILEEAKSMVQGALETAGAT